MRIAIASDHEGYDSKIKLMRFLRLNKYQVRDLGTHNRQSVDYPDFAEAVGLAILNKQADRGIIICGSGVGVCIAANKLPGIRACLCHDIFSAHQGVEHDDMNVLCLGAWIVGDKMAEEITRSFLSAEFSNKPRHLRRLKKVLALTTKYLEKNNGFNSENKRGRTVPVAGLH
jgi:ribose 5-phosphate isomerase B